MALYTHVECLCGRTAAIPEGGFFPLCGSCGRRMVCPSKGRANLQVAGATGHLHGIPGHLRRYTDEQLHEGLAARGFPSLPQDWPEVPSPAGGSISLPPWEVGG